MKHTKYCYLIFALSSSALASDLVYQPVNPNFGGNPLNANGLMANAQAQNTTKDTSASAYTPKSALERFAESIQSRAFSTLFNNAFNDGTSGSLSTDDFTVILDNIDGVLTITITELETGEVTEIVIGGSGTP